MAEETSPLLLSSFVFYHLQKYPYTQFPWPSYMLSSGSNIIFSLTALAELVFKKVFFFDLNSSFFIYFFVYFFPPLGDLGD